MNDHTATLVERILKDEKPSDSAMYLDNCDEEEAVECEDIKDVLACIDELSAQYPDLPLAELAQNPLFITFAHGKGNDFRSIYEDFNGFLESIRSEVMENERKADKKMRKTGGASKPQSHSYGLSHSQIDFLDSWNRENPNYEMTPKQYAQSLKGL